jgi:hypothetical protein
MDDEFQRRIEKFLSRPPEPRHTWPTAADKTIFERAKSQAQLSFGPRVPQSPPHLYLDPQAMIPQIRDGLVRWFDERGIDANNVLARSFPAYKLEQAIITGTDRTDQSRIYYPEPCIDGSPQKHVSVGGSSTHIEWMAITGCTPGQVTHADFLKTEASDLWLFLHGGFSQEGDWSEPSSDMACLFYDSRALYLVSQEEQMYAFLTDPRQAMLAVMSTKGNQKLAL